LNVLPPPTSIVPDPAVVDDAVMANAVLPELEPVSMNLMTPGCESMYPLKAT
jgi:hypothetical protein